MWNRAKVVIVDDVAGNIKRTKVDLVDDAGGM